MAKKKKSQVLPESVSAAMDSPVNGGDTPFGSPIGGVADRRIANCAQARDLFLQLQRENQQRAFSFAQVRNQIEGGRPLDPATIAKNGEQGRTNCNFNDARSAFKRAVLPYWKMVHEVPRKISVTIHSLSPQAYQWGTIMAEAFDRFIDDWGADYFLQFEGLTNDMVQFGPGYVMWEDAITPRYKWAQTTQMLFPRRTKADPDTWELVCLRREMTASQLLEKIRDQKEKKLSAKAGWNTEQVEQAIKLATPNALQNRLLDPNFWQDMIVANDLVIGTVWPPIAVVDIWAKNHDGSISHYILSEKTEVGDYLYESKEDADSFRQIFGPIFYDVGSNGLIHAIKGFGVMNYYYATVINRLKCKAADAVGLTMSLNFQKTDDTPDEAPPVQNFSFLNVFPTNLQQLQIVPQVQQGMVLMQELQRNQNENNYTYNDNGTQADIASTDTKGQAELIASISAEGQTSQAAIYLSQMANNIFSEIFRRLCLKRGDKDANKFRKRCLELGLPEEVFDEKIEKTIKCGASPNMASPAVRSKIADQLLAMSGIPGMNLSAIRDFKVANLTGAEGVNNFVLPPGTDSQPAQRREAIIENNVMGQGQTLPVDPADAHSEHLDEHLKPAEMIVQQAQMGQNPQQQPGMPMNPPAQITPDHLAALQSVLPHCQQHLAYLEKDNTKAEVYKQLNARFRAVLNITQGLVARLARAQQNGQAQDMGTMQTAISGPRQ